MQDRHLQKQNKKDKILLGKFAAIMYTDCSKDKNQKPQRIEI